MSTASIVDASLPETVVHNPATTEAIATVATMTASEVDRVVERAVVAAEGWRAVAPGDRARLLRRFADEVDRHLDDLALVEMRNAGHLLAQAKDEAAGVSDVLEYYAAAPERLFGRQIPVAGGLDVTFHEPLGVVGVIVPWNFPMTIASWALAPALAAGNTVVLKPAQLTPLSALRLESLALAAGLAPGVFQVVTGSGSDAGWRLVTHPKVRKVCFTGSTEVGRQVMAGCAEHVKRVTLELGGKSANIVFADADIARAAQSAPSAVFDNAGQDCCARSRILVERRAYDEFMHHLEPSVLGLTVGDPADPDTEMGPLISSDHRDHVDSFVSHDAVVIQGSVPRGPGYWYPPTVLAAGENELGAEDSVARAAREEIFGPVAVVMPFHDEAEAIALANDTEYGLSGSIWTRDIGRAIRVVRGVESGNLSINSHRSVRYATPFGGFKLSGLGRELGPDAPLHFCDVKNVFVASDPT